MESTKQTKKPNPRIGMAVTWADPETLSHGDDAQFMQKSMIEKHGYGPFRIHELKPFNLNGDPRGGWIVTLTQKGQLLLDEPTRGEDFGPASYCWDWLQPIPQPKLQIGELVTWANLETIDLSVWPQAETVLRLNKEKLGLGPFVVWIQEDSCVYLVDQGGLPLVTNAPFRRNKFFRDLLQAV
jgi:hypothetical protein